jgi:hypothetical protein
MDLALSDDFSTKNFKEKVKIKTFAEMNLLKKQSCAKNCLSCRPFDRKSRKVWSFYPIFYSL